MSVQKRRPRYWWVELGVYGVLREQVVTLWTVDWRGVPASVVSFPQLYRQGPELLRAVELEAEMLLDKSTGRRVLGAEAGGLVDEEFSVLYPTLWAYLTQVAWPDGSAREVSTLSVFSDGAVAKCVLKDRAMGLCLWAACPTFSGLFGVLEALLCDPGAEWRVDRGPAGGKAARVKRPQA